MRPFILQIDESLELPGGLVEALREDGYELHQTADPEEAMRLVEERHPILVVMEIELAGCEGLDLMAGIRDPQFGSVPVLVVTQEPRDSAMHAEAIALGVEDFLTKPVRADVLRAAIHEVAPPPNGAARPAAPSAADLSGELADTPMPELLARLRRRGANGVLAVGHEGIRVGVLLRNGSPVAVSSSRRESVGETALYETFRWEQGRFAFSEGRSFEADEVLELTGDPAGMLLEGVLDNSPDRQVRDRLEKRESLYVSITEESELPLEAKGVGFTRRQRELLEGLGGEDTLSVLLGSRLFDERLVYGLWVGGWLELQTAPTLTLTELLGDSNGLEPEPAQSPQALDESRQQLKELARTRKESEQELADLERSRAVSESELHALAQIREEREQELADLARARDERAQELEALAPALDEGAQELEELGRVRAEREHELNALARMREERERELEELTQSREERERELEELARAREERARELEALAPALDEGAQELEALARTRAECEQELEELGRARAEHARELESLAQARAEHVRELEELALVREERAQELKELAEARTEREQELDALGQARAERARELEELALVREERSQELEELTRTRAEREQELAALGQARAERAQERTERGRMGDAGSAVPAVLSDAPEPSRDEPESEVKHGEIAPVVAPPPGADPEALSRSLRGLARRVLAGDDFQALGIAPTASDQEVRAAYEGILREIPEIEPTAANLVHAQRARRIRSRIEAAFANLQDDEKRRAYSLMRAEEEQDRKAKPSAERALEGERWFRKGKAHLERRRCAEAVEAFGMATHLDPEQGEYASHLGYALYLSNPNDDVVQREAMDHVARGIKRSPKNELSYVYLGRILKGKGDIEVAKKIFLKALRIKPDFHPAVQELRVLEMRERRGKGVLSRLIGR